MKIIHLSDVHFISGNDLLGIDPQPRLSAAVADINANNADAKMVIISGDLAHSGEVAAYLKLKGVLADLKVPYALMVGNHDKRANLLQVFPETPRDRNGFLQQAFVLNGFQFILLDTLDEGFDHGVLSDERLAWLDEKLERSRETPTYIFMHHPPLPIGITAMDVFMLKQPERLRRIVENNRQIRHIFFGHVHRRMSGNWNGVSISCVPAIHHQVSLDTSGEMVLKGNDGDPAYAVVLIEENQLMVHLHDYMTPHRHMILDDEQTLQDVIRRSQHVIDVEVVQPIGLAPAGVQAIPASASIVRAI